MAEKKSIPSLHDIGLHSFFAAGHSRGPMLYSEIIRRPMSTRNHCCDDCVSVVSKIFHLTKGDIRRNLGDLITCFSSNRQISFFF